MQLLKQEEPTLVEAGPGTPRAAPPAAPVAAPAAPPDALTVEELRTFVDWARHRDFLARHQWHPESACELVQQGILARGDGAVPFAVAVLRAGRAVTMLVGQIVDAAMPLRAGYRVIHAPRLRLLEVLHGGVLGDRSPECIGQLQRAVRGVLARGGADAALFRNVEVGSAVHETFHRRSHWLFRDGGAERSRNWRLLLPGSFAEFRRAQSRSAREDAKRYERRLRRDFGDGVRVVHYGTPADVPGALVAVEQVAASTYQRGLCAGFLPTPEQCARWHEAAQLGWLAVDVLEVAGRPAAFTTGYRVGGTLWLEHIGFDPKLRSYQPGGFLIQRVIERACDRDRLQAVDFGVGDADYKRRLCGHSGELITFHVFAPTLFGLYLGAVRRAGAWLGAAARALMSRLGLLSRLRSRWRRRLEPATRDPETP
ncbi:MAG: GNAT family N-acetyltransferase [Planctomycetes bacterium]|nr:GNAT family N-acetyltransferase [Planctomycetota bacterium]